MEQDKVINEIVDFVGHNQESTASISIFRRILGFYPEQISNDTLSNLQKGLETADPEEIESCYYLIK